jgi:putative transposase
LKPIFRALFALVTTVFRSRLSMQLEIVVLRQQLAVYQKSARRPHIQAGDRILWVWFSRHWSRWRDVLVFVQPETVIAWQRKRFSEYWAKLSGHHRFGRPAVAEEVKALIRKISGVNPGWGSPRIGGELHKLGIEVAKSTVDKYRVRFRKPPSSTWKAFLGYHAKDLVAIDFFTVPTATFKVLFVLVVLSHVRRRVVYFNVTEHPTAQWTAQQIIEAFPWDKAPQYLLRDRDSIYGVHFQRRLQSLGIVQVITAPRSPWQNPYVERLIGSIRRDCLNHVVVLNDRHLKRILASYFDYYHRWRTHLSLMMDSPDSRSVQPPLRGRVVQFPEVGGLHHHYERRAV